MPEQAEEPVTRGMISRTMTMRQAHMELLERLAGRRRTNVSEALRALLDEALAREEQHP